jgi:hypothetical protein
VALDLPLHLVNTYAHRWAASKREFVLIEDAEDWLTNNEVHASLSYTGQYCEGTLVEYTLTFERYDHAFNFALVWL